MTGFLRFIGIINAAIWFGAGVFFTFAVGPGVFSADVRALFGESAFPYYAGGVALVLIKRYFILQYLCGLVALAHLFAEKLYLGRRIKRRVLALVLVLLGLALVGGFWLQPKMRQLRQTIYLAASEDQKEAARHVFGVWHGASQVANLFIILGVLVYLVHVTLPPEERRFGSFMLFRS